MPRLVDSQERTRDFCKTHWPARISRARLLFGTYVQYDCEHPPYGDDEYTCTTCHRPLTDEDNG